MRGIVISPDFGIEKDGGLNFGGAMYDIDIRRYMLYWDKLDYPINNVIDLGMSPDMAYLEKVGMLRRTPLFPTSIGGPAGEIMLQFQEEAYEINNKKEPGQWALAQPRSELKLTKDNATKGRFLEVNLYQCLPVPLEEVSLDDILEFKNRRNDELIEFRFLIDRLYLDAIDSGDFERAKAFSLELIRNKVNEIEKVMTESKLKSIRKNFSTNISVSRIVSDALKAAGGSALIGAPPSLGALAGAVASYIDIGLKVGSRPKITVDNKPYAYLIHAKDERII